MLYKKWKTIFVFDFCAYLISTGSCKPTFANSTRILGKVAEKSKVCRESGNRVTISFSCSDKPISNNLSASSNTTYSTLFNFNSISTQMCKKRPGVATIISGLPWSAENWLSMASPPRIIADFKPVNFPNSLVNFSVCNKIFTGIFLNALLYINILCCLPVKPIPALVTVLEP